jgi:hypothetical protein
MSDEQKLEMIIGCFMFPWMLELRFYMYIYSDQFPKEHELIRLQQYHKELQEHVALTYINVWEKSLVTRISMPIIVRPNDIMNIQCPVDNVIDLEINYYKKMCEHLDEQLVVYNDYLNN